MLRQRGAGVRESGAFLLGTREGEARVIKHFIPYDDIDPHALRGMILFDGAAMDQVWSICDERGLDVIADIHTHPAGYGQSDIDRANPMISERGHIALIMPDYARRAFGPGEVGMYELRGAGHWLDHSRRGRAFFKLVGK
jgi:proteasome lid subunit RPN8/RPN11